MNAKELSDKIYHLLDYNVVAMPTLKRRLSDDIVMKCEQYADHETEELRKEVECLYENERNLIDLTKQLKQENKELREGIKNMFLDLGSKWHDNEITIKNPTRFIKTWKNVLLTKTNKDK